MDLGRVKTALGMSAVAARTPGVSGCPQPWQPLQPIVWAVGEINV